MWQPGVRTVAPMASSIFVDILVVLLAAKLAGELAERVALPAVCGEIVAGMLVGPSVLGWVHGDETLHVLAELGVILLLFGVGLETELADLLAVGRAALAVAIVGVVVPFAAGYAVALALGIDSDAAVFVGAALTATSVGITARVFGDLRSLTSIEARTVLGAAVADDVMGLVVLTIVVGVIADGNASLGGISTVVLEAVGFLLVASWLGTKLVPHLFRHVARWGRGAGTLVAVALAFTLGMSQLAHLAGLAPIIGAFVAGLALRASPVADRVHHEMTPLGHVFIPVFFLQIGIDADISEFGSFTVLRLAGGLLVVAVLGKLASALVLRKGQGDKLLVGIGMVPRGEVGLIFATIGLDRAIFGTDLYAALLLVVVATTIVTPPLLRMHLGTVRTRTLGVHDGPARPAAAWFTGADDRFDLVDDPPVSAALAVTFHAALLGREARPGDRLLDWTGRLPDEPLPWDAEARAAFVRVLDTGNARSWRFLAVTGVLERAVPELVDALRRRQRDLSDLDPAGAYSLPRLARLRTLPERAALVRPEHVALASFLLDVVPDGDLTTVAPQVLDRMGVDGATHRAVSELLRDAPLLAGAAQRLDVLDEDNLVQFAAHVRTDERAQELLVLTLASGDLGEVDEARLRELHDLLRQALLAGAGDEAATAADEARRRDAMGRAEDRFVRDRIAVAPRSYVLAVEPGDLVRQASLCEPPLGGRNVRVAVLPLGSGEWRVDIAARDRTALLAHECAALRSLACDAREAVVATWGDRQAIGSFRVASPSVPEAGEIARLVEARFDRPAEPPAVPDARVEFDDHASPWHTILRVECDDRQGVLHAVTAAISASGADVHAARVVTRAGRAVDVFELGHAGAGRLPQSARDAIEEAIHDGGATVPARRGRRRAGRP
jgi:Kef-type K+ transport system membrane component KefB